MCAVCAACAACAVCAVRTQNWGDLRSRDEHSATAGDGGAADGTAGEVRAAGGANSKMATRIKGDLTRGSEADGADRVGGGRSGRSSRSGWNGWSGVVGMVAEAARFAVRARSRRPKLVDARSTSAVGVPFGLAEGGGGAEVCWVVAVVAVLLVGARVPGGGRGGKDVVARDARASSVVFGDRHPRPSALVGAGASAGAGGAGAGAGTRVGGVVGVMAVWAVNAHVARSGPVDQVGGTRLAGTSSMVLEGRIARGGGGRRRRRRRRGGGGVGDYEAVNGRVEDEEDSIRARRVDRGRHGDDGRSKVAEDGFDDVFGGRTVVGNLVAELLHGPDGSPVVLGV